MTRKANHQTSDSPLAAGARSSEQWREELRADPAFQAIYEEEAAKSKLWLQLVEARL